MLFNKAIPALDAACREVEPYRSTLRNGQMLCFPGLGDLFFVAGDIPQPQPQVSERFKKAAAARSVSRIVT